MKNKKIIFMIIGILAVIALGFGVTYAWLTLTLNGTKNNVLKIGTLSLVLDDATGEGINLEGSVPMLEEIGLILEPYTFTLTNNGNVDSEYAIYLDDIDLEIGEERVDPEMIRFALTKDKNIKMSGFTLGFLGEHPSRILEMGKLSPNESHQYELRLWVSEDADNTVMGQVFRGKIRIEAVQAGRLLSEECFVFEEGTIMGYQPSCPKDVVIPSVIKEEAVTAIGSFAFAGQELTSVVIPDSTTHIGSEAFSMNGLTSVTIPSSVTTIEYAAFQNNQLTSITIPSSVTSIGQSAFADNQLTNVTIPLSVKNIGASAFSGNKLVSITIPSTITSIERYVFMGNQLTSITIPSSVTSIGQSAFTDNKLTSITIPSSVTSIGSGAFNNNQLSESQAFIYKRNSDGNEDKTTVISYGGAKRNNVVIPSNITTIGDSAFSGNQLTSITIPSSITEIGSNAFQVNKLTNVTIPSSVTSIGEGAFAANQLTGVTIQGKTNKNAFTTYPNRSPFGWASGYSDANITWNG